MLDGPNRIRSSSLPIQTGLIQRPAQLARPFFPLAMCVSLICLALLLLTAACRDDTDPQRVRPRQLRDVPSRALAFNFQADVEPPPAATADDTKIVPAIQDDFDKRHPDFALLRTVVSPDNQRALALYNTAD